MRLKFSPLLLLRAAIAAGLILAFNVITFGQNPMPVPSVRPQKEEKAEESMDEEMRIKREISYAQKEHKENLKRAEELSSLGAEIGSTFKEKNNLDRSDLKKLDKLEKLTKSIRRAAGGSDDECEMKEMPTDLPAIISKVAELSEALKVEVEKTPRRVISTAVIDRANVLLELIRRVRDLSART